MGGFNYINMVLLRVEITCTLSAPLQGDFKRKSWGPVLLVIQNYVG